MLDAGDCDGATQEVQMKRRARLSHQKESFLGALDSSLHVSFVCLCVRKVGEKKMAVVEDAWMEKGRGLGKHSFRCSSIPKLDEAGP